MANTHNLNNVVIDRVLRGIFSTEKDGIIFSLNQVQNFSLNCTSESQEIVDALGVSIMELMRSKAVEASAENAIFDLGLMAAQYGTNKVVATADAKLIVPTMESFVVDADEDGNVKPYALKHTPKAAPEAIYALNGDSTLGAKYTKAKDTAATATEFTYADGVITLPTDIAAGADMFVMYDYESENAVEVINSANKFPSMGKMTFECLVYDVCDPETKIFAYVVLPRFQLKSDFDWSVGGDSQTHPFSGKAHVNYCDKNKQMVRVVIVDDEEDEAEA
jgi:hypothetical protein